ncbi:MAG: Ig-like domain-containing protein [Ruminococcus sp.]|nr:Ig-like domain-containing protein [Ruminococcus sp.]
MKRFFTFLLLILTAAAFLAACGKPLTLDPTELDMTIGDSARLDAGDAVKINWSSSDSSVAAVNGGTVIAKSAGTAIITASLENGETASCNVTVADKLINVITLDVKSARIETGKTIQLSASYAPADATKTDLSWESSDNSIAAVDKDGYVTGVSEGIVTITCKSDNDVEASCTVTVGAAPAPTFAATLPPMTEAPTQPAPTPTEKPADDSADETTAPAPVSGGSFVFAESSARYLTADEIAARLSSMSGSPVSDSFAQDAINEIFARHGYVFRTPSIRAYYESQPWYSPDQSYDGTLSDVEQYNIVLLSGY